MDEPRIQIAGLSHPGKVRENQEDAWGISEPQTGAERRLHGRLLVVADGVGGSQCGEVASRLGVECTTRAYLSAAGEPRSRLRAAIQFANHRILEETESHREYRGMGSTIVAALIHGDQLIVAWLGDSRAYLLRDRELIQLTRDHHGSGFAGIKSQGAGLTRWLGMAVAVDPDLRQLPLQPGDRILLCTDGLHNLVNASEIARVPREGVERWASDLVNQSLKRGAPDNVTVICAQIDRLPFAPHRLPDLKSCVMLDGLKLDHQVGEDQFYLWYRAHSPAGQRLLSILKPEYQADAGLLLDMEANEESLARTTAADVAIVERADSEKSMAYTCLSLPWEASVAEDVSAGGGELHCLDQVLAMLGSQPGTIDVRSALNICHSIAGALTAVRTSLIPAGAPHPTDFWGDGSRYALCHWPGVQRQYAVITSKGVQANPLLEPYLPPDYTPPDEPGPGSDAYFVGWVLSELLGDRSDPLIPLEVRRLCAALLSDRAGSRPEPCAAIDAVCGSLQN